MDKDCRKEIVGWKMVDGKRVPIRKKKDGEQSEDDKNKE